MNNGFLKRSVRIDGANSLDISVSEEKQTVITELISQGKKPVLLYAEKFSEPCNYLKAGIKMGIEYLIADKEFGSEKTILKKLENFSKKIEPDK